MKRLLPLLSFAVLTLLVTPSAYAEVRVSVSGEGNNSVSVKSNTSVHTTSKSSGTVKNTITINGETILDEEKEVNDDSANSNIDVSIKNGEGTVKYDVDGEEKTVKVTPKVTQKAESNVEVKVSESSQETPLRPADAKALAGEQGFAGQAKGFKGMQQVFEKMFEQLFSFF